MRSAVQARFSNHTFKSSYSSLGKKKNTYPISEQSVNREVQRYRETELLFTAHMEIFPKDDSVRTFFVALLTSLGRLCCTVFYFLPSEALANKKFLSPSMLPRKMGSQHKLPKVC